MSEMQKNKMNEMQNKKTNKQKKQNDCFVRFAGFLQ